jgi:hypothetical protein
VRSAASLAQSAHSGIERRRDCARVQQAYRFKVSLPAFREYAIRGVAMEGVTELRGLQKTSCRVGFVMGRMERETGFEPATSTLARLHSTS